MYSLAVESINNHRSFTSAITRAISRALALQGAYALQMSRYLGARRVRISPSIDPVRSISKRRIVDRAQFLLGPRASIIFLRVRSRLRWLRLRRVRFLRAILYEFYLV